MAVKNGARKKIAMRASPITAAVPPPTPHLVMPLPFAPLRTS